MVTHFALFKLFEMSIHSHFCCRITFAVNQEKHCGSVLLLLTLDVDVGEELFIHQKIIDTVHRQNLLNFFDRNIVVHLLVKTRFVLWVVGWVKCAG